MTHVKPTKEELEAQIKKAQEEANNPPPDPAPADPPGDNPPPGPDPDPTPSPAPPDDPPPADDPGKKDPQPGDPDYKKKFIESTREAQILHAKNRKMVEAFDKANEVPDPTDDEMQREYADWETMSDLEKKLARNDLKNSRRFESIRAVAKDFKDLEVWQKNVDQFVDDPKTLADHPDLEGRQDEFRIFATKPSRRGVPFEDIVASFLWVESQKPKKKNKGKMFEQGSGGPNDPPIRKSDKISLEEANKLMKTNYKEYKRLLTAGKIDMSAV